jgi:hypothetical protein
VFKRFARRRAKRNLDSLQKPPHNAPANNIFIGGNAGRFLNFKFWTFCIFGWFAMDFYNFPFPVNQKIGVLTIEMKF